MNYFSKSKIFLYLLISFILGLALASFFYFNYFYLFILLIIIIFLIILFWQYKIFRIILFCLIFCLAGLVRFQLSIKEPPQIESNNQKLKGLVYKEPTKGDNQKVKVKIKESHLKNENLLITSGLYPEYHYGDILLITGEIKEPENFEDFDYRSYLSRYNIYLVSYKPKIEIIERNKGTWFLANIYKIRNHMSETIKISLKQPQSSILQAMMLGLKKEIPDEVRDNFSKAGISHIIAISGLHITIIAGILMNLALGLGLNRRRAFWLASAGLFLFIILVGMPSSAVRAGIMGFLVLLAMYLGRLNNSTNAFVLAGSLMLLVNPKLLRYDIGFQLSFLAVLGLIYIGPYLEKLVEKVPEIFNIKSTVLMTLSAQFFTLPLIIFYFQRFSLIAPLANVLVLPVLPFVLISGFLGVIFSLIFLPLGQLIFWPCYLLLKYISGAASFLSEIKFSSFAIENFDFNLILIIYLIIFLIIILIKKPLFRKELKN
ncbi:MAG: ComEC/Rec2 family competence protein [Patescibacteria group bacterium]|nr:ComEC/Rec2 family competence protein [Patescibacteria group bacterium]